MLKILKNDNHKQDLQPGVQFEYMYGVMEIDDVPKFDSQDQYLGDLFIRSVNGELIFAYRLTKSLNDTQCEGIKKFIADIISKEFNNQKIQYRNVFKNATAEKFGFALTDNIVIKNDMKYNVYEYKIA